MEEGAMNSTFNLPDKPIPFDYAKTMTATQKIEAYLRGELLFINLKECLDDIRHDVIIKAVESRGGNKTKAAQSIGYNRTTLLHWMIDKYKVNKGET
jgi:DNA-binding NtrC family response regulator